MSSENKLENKSEENMQIDNDENIFRYIYGDLWVYILLDYDSKTHIIEKPIRSVFIYNDDTQHMDFDATLTKANKRDITHIAERDLPGGNAYYLQRPDKSIKFKIGDELTIYNIKVHHYDE